MFEQLSVIICQNLSNGISVDPKYFLIRLSIICSLMFILYYLCIFLSEKCLKVGVNRCLLDLCKI